MLLGMRSMNPKAAALTGLPLLAGVDARRVRELALRSDEIDLTPGATLIAQGHLNRHAYVVLSGSVSVSVGGDAVAVVGPGSIVGERAAVTHDLANATVVVLEPTTVLAIDHRSLLGIAGEHPVVRERLDSLVDDRDRQIAA